MQRDRGLIGECTLPIAAWVVIVALAVMCDASAADADEKGFEAAVALLKEASLVRRVEAVERLQASPDARTLPTLQALLEGTLHYRSTDDRLLIVVPRGGRVELRDVVSGAIAHTLDKEGLKKVIINNQLRLKLRDAIARLSLSHDDPALRLQAVRELTSNLDASAQVLLREALETEKDGGVRGAIETGLALGDLDSPDRGVRLAALAQLENSLDSSVRNRLRAFLSDSAGDAEMHTAARQVLNHIESRVRIYGLIETVFFGLSLGSVLVLASIGLAITFGVMGVINMAHGELIMLGAYTTYVIQQLTPAHLELSIFIAIPAAFLVSGLVGVAIDRGVIRFLHGRPLETLLATFGVSLILQQAVRSIFSPLNRSVSTPAWMSGSLEINGALSLTYNRLYITLFGMLVFFALVVLLKSTRLGLQVRAVAQNRAMAKAMGIRTEWVDAMTFGLGSGIAGIAGVALSQLTNVGPNLGQGYIIDSFMVVVFGGVGNLWGTLVGGFSLGVVNKFLEPYAGAVLAKILVLVFIIIYIQKRPRGLFPQKGRAAEG